jgi:hypothetical protein
MFKTNDSEHRPSVSRIGTLCGLVVIALLVVACAQRDPLLGIWTASQAEPAGKPPIDKAQLEALGMNMTIQLNEDKSFALELGKAKLKGGWDYAKDAKKLNLKIDPAQSSAKDLPSLTFEAVEIDASKSLKMSLPLATGQPLLAFTFLPAK